MFLNILGNSTALIEHYKQWKNVLTAFVIGEVLIEREYYIFAKISNPLNMEVVVSNIHKKIIIQGNSIAYYKEKMVTAGRPTPVTFQVRGSNNKIMYPNGKEVLEIVPNAKIEMTEIQILDTPRKK